MMTNLTQKEIDELSAEDYSYFLSYGELPPTEELNEVEYESYLRSHLLYDL